MESASSLPRISADSRRALVVQALRRAIETGEFQPGDRLVERDLSAQMNISRGPLREAMIQLEQEGLITTYPYRGTVVAEISAEEVEKVLVPIRLTLERFAVGHALQRLTDADLAELQGQIGAMRQAAAAGDVTGVVETDMRFHEILLERAEQPQCLQIWRTIAPRVRAYFHRDAYRHGELANVAHGHDALLEALRRRDPAEVDAILQAHINETLDL
ncbi:GntR family transcriptional regulator [Kribbella sandramycini]|uniref:GntR family transcriptional regulator n=1 Tax=Kribbella sandramycini TaxID=60450 RepID=A0A7Y4KZZ0_9ACTN|nr:GntR family transcriptional regulator [Kribbella sandramycini]MBB6569120.1 DNA-binding GntR family transcriptional regulator [Kribbella sandramycini]NOL41037.1 GntR family transcriptional regulator [Kribbella sandramycini]